jgi:hypothetical protein
MGAYFSATAPRSHPLLRCCVRIHVVLRLLDDLINRDLKLTTF